MRKQLAYFVFISYAPLKNVHVAHVLVTQKEGNVSVSAVVSLLNLLLILFWPIIQIQCQNLTRMCRTH